MSFMGRTFQFNGSVAKRVVSTFEAEDESGLLILGRPNS